MLAETVKRWHEEATQKGREEGREEGKSQGVLEGETTILVRLATRRYGTLPDWAISRIQNATTDQLEHWADRILDAQKLDEFLKD